VKNAVMFLLLGAFLAVAAPAHADTLFSTLGPGLTYQASPNRWATGAFCSPDCTLGMPFTLSAGQAFNLTQIDIGLTYITALGGTDAAIVQIFSDTAGRPGAMLPMASWTLTGLPDLVTSIQPSQVISGISGITLAGGTQYWLVAGPGDPTSALGWNFDPTSQTGTGALSLDGGATWPFLNTEVLGAFDIQGTPVPEPSSIFLLVMGLAGVFLVTHRHGAARHRLT
jgi:PEP-CTERM motif